MWFDESAEDRAKQAEELEREVEQLSDARFDAENEVEGIENSMEDMRYELKEAKQKLHSLTYARDEAYRRWKEALHPTRGLPTPLLDRIE